MQEEAGFGTVLKSQGSAKRVEGPRKVRPALMGGQIQQTSPHGHTVRQNHFSPAATVPRSPASLACITGPPASNLATPSSTHSFWASSQNIEAILF